MNKLPYLTYNDLPTHTDKTKKIPKYVFRTSSFTTSNMPSIVYNNLLHLTINNTDYKQYYFDDDDVEKFILEYFPHYYKYYIVLIPGAFRADLWRLLVLYKYGGIYNDIGHQYLKKIDDMIDTENDEFVSVADTDPIYAIHNAFFAVYPEHPIIKTIIDIVVINISSKYYGTNPLEITGPIACGIGFNSFFQYPVSTPIKVGKYRINNFNVHLLYHSVGNHHYMNRYIVNKTGNKLIKTKFDGYYNIVYDKKNLHYGDYYRMGRVYHSSTYVFFKTYYRMILIFYLIFMITAICIATKLISKLLQERTMLNS